MSLFVVVNPFRALSRLPDDNILFQFFQFFPPFCRLLQSAGDTGGLSQFFP